jgi:excisionase family DNA binding protein
MLNNNGLDLLLKHIGTLESDLRDIKRVIIAMETNGENIASPMLSVSAVCQILHIHPNTLRRWTNQGWIKCIRLGKAKHRRYRNNDIQAFLSEYGNQYNDCKMRTYKSG